MDLHAQQLKFDEGIRAVEGGDTAYGLACFDAIAPWFDTEDPLYCSYRAVCLAKERKDFAAALELLRYAREMEPKNTLHFLNLGRVHVIAGNKPEAIRVFRDGLLYGKNEKIHAELAAIGWRRVPVFPSLGREHPLNRCLGKLTKRFRSA